MNIKVLSLFLPVLLFAGCIHETLDPCPEGDVKVNIYAERFQAVTHNFPEDMETSFHTRIKDLHYFLFKDNALIKEGRISDTSSSTGPSYTFDFGKLAFGDYCLSVVSNCSADIQGDAPDNLFFTYAGVDNKEDYFSLSFPFTVDCDCETEYNAYLERAHGVIRYNFYNIPPHTTGIEVSITNLGNRKQINGDYSGQDEITKRISVEELVPAEEGDALVFALGTFPTTKGEHSTCKIALYNGEDETPWYAATITGEAIVRRNQLLDITARFTGDIPSFEVKVDTSWGGSNSGGGTDIN